MPRVHRLKIEPMTEESFEPFGELIDPKERPSDHRVISPIAFEADGQGTLGVIWQPYEGRTFNQLERHFAVTQSFVQLAGSPAVVAVAAPTDIDDPMAAPDPEEVRAFLIDPAKGYALKRGTWHSLNRYILAPPGATFVIMNSNPNPTQIVDYQESYGLTYSDLGSDEKPTRVDFKGKYDVVFEIGL